MFRHHHVAILGRKYIDPYIAVFMWDSAHDLSIIVIFECRGIFDIKAPFGEMAIFVDIGNFFGRPVAALPRCL